MQGWRFQCFSGNCQGCAPQKECLTFVVAPLLVVYAIFVCKIASLYAFWILCCVLSAVCCVLLYTEKQNNVFFSVLGMMFV